MRLRFANHICTAAKYVFSLKKLLFSCSCSVLYICSSAVVPSLLGVAILANALKFGEIYMDQLFFIKTIIRMASTQQYSQYLQSRGSVEWLGGSIFYLVFGKKTSNIFKKNTDFSALVTFIRHSLQLLFLNENNSHWSNQVLIQRRSISSVPKFLGVAGKVSYDNSESS